MKFVCLIYAESMLEQMSPAMAEQHMQEYAGFIDDIRKSGHYLGCSRLLPPQSAVTLRVRDGKTSVTDGPWVETKEQLGGFFMIEAKDRDEAVRIAARIPCAQAGCVEIRTIAEDALTMETLGLNPV